MAFARRMRQLAITNMPDPLNTGDNLVQQMPDRAVRNSATFKAAEQAHKQHLPADKRGGGGG